MKMYPSFSHLKGKRVLVTRGAGQAARDIAALSDAGAIPIHIPLIEICAPDDNFASLDESISRLERYEWLVFTSANGVDAFFSRLGGRAIPEFAEIAAVGPSTAKEIAKRGASVSLIPDRHDSAGLLDALLSRVEAGDRILFPRAMKGSMLLIDGLRSRGFTVDVVEAYRTILPPQVDSERLIRIVERAEVDAVLFASPSAVENFILLVGEDRAKKIADKISMIPIGDATRSALSEFFK